MAEAAVPLLQPVVEKIVNSVSEQIKRQFNYLCCFTSNIDSLNNELKKLNDDIDELDEKVKKASENSEKPVPQLKTWLEDSKKMKNKISGILSDATKVGGGCCSKLGARSLSRRAKKTAESAAKLRGEKPIKAEFLPPPSPATQAVLLGNTFKCESRKKVEENIMIALRGGKVNMIGIWGMGGLGKTTIAKKLMNRALHERVFEEIVIATVSQEVEMTKVQDKIAESLGLKLDEVKTQDARAQKLLARLSCPSRTLLVLDDVRSSLKLEDIVGIPRGSEVCTILFTSRDRNVLRDMDAKIFDMELLSENEAWLFFREQAGACVKDNPIAKQVVKECGRLPLALAAVGAILKDEHDIAKWDNALEELKARVSDAVEFEDRVCNILKWSYDRLNSKSAQSLFLMCCLFPEDADIPLEYLTIFSMGLRIFEDITNMQHARNKISTWTGIFKDRSLLLESDKKDCVRIHDVVRDACTFIAKEEGRICKDECTWISSAHPLSGSECSNLRLLFLNRRFDSSGFKFDDAFLRGMRKLQVLGIEQYTLTTLLLPTQSLGKLNTLIFDSCEKLKTISVVGELVNLEILICRNCESIEKLPQEVKQLKCLKVLELTRCKNLISIERGIISSLVKLEELKMLWSFDKWEPEQNAGARQRDASLTELEELTNLACLEIDIKDPSLMSEKMHLLLEKILRFKIRIERYSRLPSGFNKAISLCLGRETRLGNLIERQLLKDIECLYLSGDGANNVDLAKGQKIRWLELGECERMKNVVRTSSGDAAATVFPSIEHLKLYSLPELQEICDGQISSTSFGYLKELKLKALRALTQLWKSSNNLPHFSNLSSIDIEECHRLRNLGQLSMAGKDCFPQLQQLRVSNCEMMQQVFLWNDEEAGKVKTSTESQRKQIFPKLKEVKLLSLPNLKTFYQGIQGFEFPQRMEIMVYKCPKMERFSMGFVAAPNFNWKLVEIDDEEIVGFVMNK